MRSVALTIGHAVLLGLASWAPAFAKVTQYECTFVQSSTAGGWVPEVAFIIVDEAAGTIEVYDPIIDHFVGKPIPGRLVAETKVRKTFGWEYEANTQGQGGIMRYRMSYFLDGRPTTMSIEPGPYRSISGEGSCKVSIK